MQVHADIDTVKVVLKNLTDYAAGQEKNNLAFLTFDLQVQSQPVEKSLKSCGKSYLNNLFQADPNPLSNWNVKQL